MMMINIIVIITIIIIIIIITFHSRDSNQVWYQKQSEADEKGCTVLNTSVSIVWHSRLPATFNDGNRRNSMFELPQAVHGTQAAAMWSSVMRRLSAQLAIQTEC